MSERRIMPMPDRDSAHYWESLAKGVFEIQHCVDCGRWTWPPRPICSGCQGEMIEWAAVKGTGTVYSWVVVHRAMTPALAANIPYTTVLVRLDEQDDILIPGRLLSDSDAQPGLRVRATAERVGDDVLGVGWTPMDAQ